MTTGMEKTSFSGCDGIQLMQRVWRSDRKTIAALMLVHGIGEHCGRYGRLVSACNNRGVDVYSYDLRGHGESQGRRGHVQSWSQYRDDLGIFINRVEKTIGSLPVFLMGHSLGSLIVLDYVTIRQPSLRGLISSGTALQPAGVASPFLVMMAKILSRVYTTCKVSLGFSSDTLSRDPEALAELEADPLTFGKVTARWGAESLAAVKRIRETLGQLSLPLLAIHGELDSVNLLAGAEELFGAVSSEDKHLIVHPNGHHEPHNDTDGEKAAALVADWIVERAL